MLCSLVFAITQGNFRFAELEFPVLGGQREFVLGAAKRDLQIMGLYVDNERKLWDESGKAPMNWENTRIGTMTWTVEPAIVGSTACTDVNVDSSRTLRLKRYPEFLELKLRSKRSWYVDASGRLIRDRFTMTVGESVWSMDATFEKDTYTVRLTSPDKGTRTLGPIHAGMGMDELTTTAFKPMIDADGKIVRQEKDFYVLDPFTGGAIKHHLRYKGKFSAKWGDSRYTGSEFEMTGGTEKETISITKEGWLMKVVLEKYKYLHLEDQPKG